MRQIKTLCHLIDALRTQHHFYDVAAREADLTLILKEHQTNSTCRTFYNM